MEDKRRKTYFDKMNKALDRVNQHSTEPLTYHEALTMLERCEKNMSTCEEAQMELLCLCTDDEGTQLQESAFEPIEGRYIELKSQLKRLIDELKPTSGRSSTTGETSEQPKGMHVKLPPLELPTFDGNFANWPSFKDLFLAIVDGNDQLSSAQKLQYLKSTLQHEPASLIKAMSITDDNYKEAWTLLKERYDNTREIVSSLILRLLNYKPINHESAPELQKFIDNTNECLSALRVLKQPVDHWDSFLVVLHITKLDQSTRREWAIRQVDTKLPTFKEFSTFITMHIRGLQASATTSQPTRRVNPERSMRVHHSSTNSKCAFCDGHHPHYQCKEFNSLSSYERKQLVEKNNLCYNCLNRDHRTNKCNSKATCRKCNGRHHTLLHYDKKRPNQSKDSSSTNPSVTRTATQSTSTASQPPPIFRTNHVMTHSEVILPTAVVQVQDGLGGLQLCRLFLDQGSQATLITQDCVSRLNLPRQWSRASVSGIFLTSECKIKGKVSLSLYHVSNPNISFQVEALITPPFTGNLPSTRVEQKNWRHLSGIQLADPHYHRPAPVDILIGSEYVGFMKMSGLRQGPTHTPVAEETIFGWVLSGKVGVSDAPTVTINHVIVPNLDTIVRRFWEIEEPPSVRILTKDEKSCENHFLNNFSQDKDGRFVVAIPFNDRLPNLGTSKAAALRRQYQVEKRLQRQPQLQQQYIAFMREYEALGHMHRIPKEDEMEIVGRTNYLPHHFVINENSSTTKLRVVFDGSTKTSTGISFNDTLLIGPPVQSDLYDILLRFRLHPIVLKSDVTKMFRQFHLTPEDADFHRIVWRESSDQPMLHYRLNTITYGTAYAPYMATRCLTQLGIQIKDQYPAASHAILYDTYVDDLMTGTTTTEMGIRLYEDLTSAASSAQLELRKWSSNDPTVLSHIPPEHRETNPIDFDTDQTIKALGVQWSPTSDQFSFKFTPPATPRTLTKRTLLSELARVYDPLGFISCVTIRAKLQLQELWKMKVDWDDQVPDHIYQAWVTYQDELKQITCIKIPRFIAPTEAKYELHGFSDASERAYGAMVYLRAICNDGTIKVNLITSKTRVTPLRQVSLPRLELNGALILADLIVHVKRVLNIDATITCWTDSTITLRWIAAQPRRWQTYVANRVAKIHDATPTESWRHVPGKENPADLLSRGISCLDLIDNHFWWCGPLWLSEPTVPIFPFSLCVDDNNLEERKQPLLTHHVVTDLSILHKFSSLLRLKRVTAYLFRAIYNFRNPSQKVTSSLTVSELQHAQLFWIRKVQQQAFQLEIKSLKNQHSKEESKPVKNHSLHFLHPYLDHDGILRVGGRLHNAAIPEARKHQIILPFDSHFTNLLIHHFHLSNFHSGFQLTFSLIHSEFWIVRGRDRVRNIIRKCVTCRRHRAQASTQLMGSLPQSRVTPTRPFFHTGVDYAGPFILKNPIGRIPKTYKGYLCIFVCMSTKSIHLEAVSSLSTEHFIATLRRFVARRGLCQHLYSDCGTNFVGAEKEIRHFLRTKQVNDQLQNAMSAQGISFHFNPPSSPHQGGLWEAGVKSAKHHLRRVMGKNILTYEQFSTFLCQVEAILNSRPLHPLSSDPTDFRALTPGHFLVGEPLISVPDVDMTEIKTGRLNQFQQQQQRVQHFWRRWSQEYLNTLQQRGKWYTEKENLKKDDLVLLKEETSPLDWRLARVTEVYPGVDDKVRTVLLKTASGELKRPVVKCIPLLDSN